MYNFLCYTASVLKKTLNVFPSYSQGKVKCLYCILWLSKFNTAAEKGGMF